MDDPGNMSSLKQNLATEVELALAGETARSVVLLLREDRLPMAAITDGRGVVSKKVLSYVDLLSTLDRSSVVEQLEQEASRTYKLPELPRNTMFLDLVERPSGNTVLITGWMGSSAHLFVLEERGFTEGGGQGSSTYEAPLPHLIWRAAWEEGPRRLASLSLALCSPTLEDGGGPNASTPLYRWPFSNVYGDFGGALHGVCWPTMSRMQLDLAEIPAKAVRGFVSIPNNADLYGRGHSHNAPHSDYREFLEAIEQKGGIDHDWLIPADLTVKQLHEQNRGEQSHE